MAYRISRNCEASLIDWLTEELSNAGWIGIRVEKSFSQVYKGTLPCILIEQDPEYETKLEIGSKTWLKKFFINIRIFSTSDGQRLDLKDFITDLLEDDIEFYEYAITGGEVAQKTLTGRIVILKIIRNEKELKNTENLEVVDRYRNIISFEAIVAI